MNLQFKKESYISRHTRYKTRLLVRQPTISSPRYLHSPCNFALGNSPQNILLRLLLEYRKKNETKKEEEEEENARSLAP